MQPSLESQSPPHAITSSDGPEPVAVAETSRRLIELSRRVASSDCTVLIAGESGTGEEVLARFIHRQSNRASRPFIAVNCAAIPETMLEALLFGYERGAFTGAHAAHPGKFEQAQGGTLLLDEISEMPLGLQCQAAARPAGAGGWNVSAVEVLLHSTSAFSLPRIANCAPKLRPGDSARTFSIDSTFFPFCSHRCGLVVTTSCRLQCSCCRSVFVQVSAFRRCRPTHSPSADLYLARQCARLDNVLQRALILCTGPVIEPEHIGSKQMSKPRAIPRRSMKPWMMTLHARAAVRWPVRSSARAGDSAGGAAFPAGDTAGHRRDPRHQPSDSAVQLARLRAAGVDVPAA